jgi:hypothetical protein
MPGVKEYVDFEVFKGLDHVSLAKHVVPDTFHGVGENAYRARNSCADEIVNFFSKNLSLNVKLAPKDWKTTHFAMMVGKNVITKAQQVTRDNLCSKSYCFLYCADCMTECNKCSPVAKVQFGDPTGKGHKIKVKGTVAWLFFHNCHNWQSTNRALCHAGFSLVPTPVNFITRGIYARSIAASRTLLHVEKGEKVDTALGEKKDFTEKEHPFEYLQQEYDNNFAHMPLSNQRMGNWKRKKARYACQEYVDPITHKSVVIRLFYCVSNLLGFGSTASPFEYLYDSQMRVQGVVRNKKHKLFAQEESVAVGGFVYNNVKKNQFRHTDYYKAEVFRPFNPCFKTGQDAGSHHQYGFSIITSLLKDEEKVVYIGRDDGEIVIPFNESMIVLGNLPHGGVTHCITEGNQPVWPALYVHVDTTERPRAPFDVGIVPDGYGHIDCDEDLVNSDGEADSVPDVVDDDNTEISSAGEEMSTNVVDNNKLVDDSEGESEAESNGDADNEVSRSGGNDSEAESEPESNLEAENEVSRSGGNDSEAESEPESNLEAENEVSASGGNDSEAESEPESNLEAENEVSASGGNDSEAESLRNYSKEVEVNDYEENVENDSGDKEEDGTEENADKDNEENDENDSGENEENGTKENDENNSGENDEKDNEENDEKDNEENDEKDKEENEEKEREENEEKEKEKMYSEDIIQEDHSAPATRKRKRKRKKKSEQGRNNNVHAIAGPVNKKKK